MSWFSKKQKQKQAPTLQVCNHKWKDFPWYMCGKYESDSGNLHIIITEPYVCIHCKERKDVVLQDTNRWVGSYDKAGKLFMKWLEKYKDHLQDLAIINDQIADMQMVDREYLEFYEKIKNGNIADLLKPRGIEPGLVNEYF